ATIGVPAEIRISRRDWESGWFCPRTSSAVIALSPCVAWSRVQCRVPPPGGPPRPSDDPPCAAGAAGAAAGSARTDRAAAGPGRRLRDLFGAARPARYPGLRARDVRDYRSGRIAGIRSWKVRPLAGVPRAVMVQPVPARCTLAMIWAV